MGIWGEAFLGKSLGTLTSSMQLVETWVKNPTITTTTNNQKSQ